MTKLSVSLTLCVEGFVTERTVIHAFQISLLSATKSG